MYIVGFVIPVPESKREDYKAWSLRATKLLMEHGALQLSKYLDLKLVPCKWRTETFAHISALSRRTYRLSSETYGTSH